MTRPKVVYLFGAGASQAAVNVAGGAPNILLSDISEAVFLKIRKEQRKELYFISDELADDAIDIEHLITLLHSSNIPRLVGLSLELRRLFRDEILSRLAAFSLGLTPDIFAALFDMYQIPSIGEQLKGVITLNYDQLAELGFIKIYPGINYTIATNSEHTLLKPSPESPAFIKLHGSFNWKNVSPIVLVDEHSVSENDALWIPPGLTKTTDHYPFDLLWGHAYEMLDCDILRIVGCSLNPTDMHLISLIFHTQRLLSESARYTIELVDYPSACERIARRYTYLNLVGIMEQQDFVFAVASELFSGLADSTAMSEMQRHELIDYLRPERVNLFDRWLRAKAENLFIAGGTGTTPTNTLATYMNWEGQ